MKNYPLYCPKCKRKTLIEKEIPDTVGWDYYKKYVDRYCIVCGGSNCSICGISFKFPSGQEPILEIGIRVWNVYGLLPNGCIGNKPEYGI